MGKGKGCVYGTHRVLEPGGVLPQPAWKLDNSEEIYANEILIEVERLNIDSASFRQIKQEAGGDPGKMAAKLLDIVEKRGKLHNPVTGSGGMLIGVVREIGPAMAGVTDLQVGDRIATLVSLSLTPLKIDRIKAVYLDTDQVEIEGRAILFASGIYAKLPKDLPQTLALAILDVAGAPAQTAKLVKPGDTVVVLGGGGKSGMLCLFEAKRRAGITGTVIGVGRSEESIARMARLGAADHIVQADVTDALEVYRQIEKLSGGKLADVTINCVNVPGSEMSAILATREGGIVYFFSMATSFTAAALGAEGVGKDVNMIIGNGYTKNHAVIALELLRESIVLRRIFLELYSK